MGDPIIRFDRLIERGRPRQLLYTMLAKYTVLFLNAGLSTSQAMLMHAGKIRFGGGGWVGLVGYLST